MQSIENILDKLDVDSKAKVESYENIKDLFELFEEVVYREDFELFKNLVDNLDDINIQNKYGWTLLHITIRRGQKQMLEYVLDKGADIDRVDGVGWTPLMESIMDDKAELCKLLLDRGADVNIANARGATAAALVQKFARQSMYKFFF